MNGMVMLKGWLVHDEWRILPIFVWQWIFWIYATVEKQYEKYGTCKGSIDLILNDSNRECMSGLMGKDYYGVDCAHITFQQLQKAISNTKYENCDFNEVLKMYFNHDILTKKNRQQQEQIRVQNIFKHFLEQEGKANSGFIIYIPTMILSMFVLYKLQKKMSKNV